jgi:hypothetical protein
MTKNNSVNNDRRAVTVRYKTDLSKPYHKIKLIDIANTLIQQNDNDCTGNTSKYDMTSNEGKYSIDKK